MGDERETSGRRMGSKTLLPDAKSCMPSHPHMEDKWETSGTNRFQGTPSTSKWETNGILRHQVPGQNHRCEAASETNGRQINSKALVPEAKNVRQGASNWGTSGRQAGDQWETNGRRPLKAPACQAISGATFQGPRRQNDASRATNWETNWAPRHRVPSHPFQEEHPFDSSCLGQMYSGPPFHIATLWCCQYVFDPTGMFQLAIPISVNCTISPRFKALHRQNMQAEAIDSPCGVAIARETKTSSVRCVSP